MTYKKHMRKLKVKIKCLAFRYLLFREDKTRKIAVDESDSPLEKKFSKDFIYADESCEPIKSFINKAVPVAPGEDAFLCGDAGLLKKKGTIKEDTIKIQTENTVNNWMYFRYGNDLQKDYEFSFDIKIDSAFSEIQVAFMYHDLKNRLRFMIRDNKTVVFEIIYKGEFFKGVFKKPFCLTLGEYHNFRLIVHHNQYELYIDRNPVFSVHQNFYMNLLGSGLCFIVYNKDAKGNISCSIKDDCIIG